MAAAKHRILCDEVIFNHAKASLLLDFQIQPPLTVKGKALPITTFVPKRKKRTKNLDQDFDKKELPFQNSVMIGRKTELNECIKAQEELEKELSFAKTDKVDSHLVVIEGEAGVGKVHS